MSNLIEKSTKNVNNSSTDGNVLTIKTVQIAPFRTLMTALKDILLETNITFQADGIRIVNMDKSHTILAHLHLAAENFEFYECKKDKIIIGVNMFHLFKLINSIDNDDTLTIYIENAEGERFKYPFKHLTGARALAEHIKHGGNPYDAIGKHITGLSEELASLRKFKGYVNRQEQLSEAMENVTGRVIDRIAEIKETVENLIKYVNM